MKEYTIYECEVCGKSSKDSEEILCCERSHNGCSAEELQTWKIYKEAAERAGAVVARKKNAHTEKVFEEAVERLAAFEKAHGILP